jgi:hypothetical protein
MSEEGIVREHEAVTKLSFESPADRLPLPIHGLSDAKLEGSGGDTAAAETDDFEALARERKKPQRAV